MISLPLYIAGCSSITAYTCWFVALTNTLSDINSVTYQYQVVPNPNTGCLGGSHEH